MLNISIPKNKKSRCIEMYSNKADTAIRIGLLQYPWVTWPVKEYLRKKWHGLVTLFIWMDIYHGEDYVSARIRIFWLMASLRKYKEVIH